jgi:hypothetical protein
MASRPPEFTPPANDDQARARFFIINAVRLTGAMLILLGILIFRDVLDMPEVVGWTFIPIGLFELFVMPQILARKWRTPRE